jgi:hypothetical protein
MRFVFRQFALIRATGQQYGDEQGYPSETFHFVPF